MKLTKKTIGNEDVYFENGVKKYTYSIESDGSEIWTEFDKNNNEIHSKNSDGFEFWREYDSNENLIHYKNSDGYEYWSEYDSNNNRIYHKDSDGYETWSEGCEYWSDDHPNNPKNMEVEVDIEPFKFKKEK